MTTYKITLESKKNNKINRIKGELIKMIKKKRSKRAYHHVHIIKEQESDFVRFKLDAIKSLL